jgi:hypothetical protein
VTIKIRSVGCKKRRLELAFAHAGSGARQYQPLGRQFQHRHIASLT